MKRGRIDGHLSKTDYERQDTSTDNSFPGVFSKATPNTLSSRRMVLAKKVDRKMEFCTHMKVLNRTFHDWFRAQVARDPCALMIDAAQDYVDYSCQLQDRYLRTYGEVLTFGSGDCGQLAHGIENDEDLMVKFPRIVYSLRGKHVFMIACGGLHNAVVTEEGLVYTWGCSDDGSLGRPGEETMPLLVQDIAEETVIAVACGDGQTIAVTAQGDVWGWGCYKDKEGKKWFNPSDTAPVPHKDISKQQNTPLKIKGLNDVMEVACGGVCNMARCKDGSLWSWGLGECGELGRKVPPLKTNEDFTFLRVTCISLTTLTTAVVPVDRGKTEEGGRLLACGLNNYGQLGSGGTESQPLLRHVKGLDDQNIVAVKGGMHHSLVLTSSGVLWAFGRGDSGQPPPVAVTLGIGRLQGGSAGDFAPLPEEVQLPANAGHVVSIACGSNHNLAVTDKNEVYSWGYGDMLALGHGKDKDEPTPKRLNFKDAKVENITLKQVACGGQHSAIIGSILTA
eukprot:gene6089-12293_t